MKRRGQNLNIAVASLMALSMTVEPIMAQVAGAPAGAQIQSPARPAVNRPTTLPSYPNRPTVGRPNRPSRPPMNRPVTLPSYPDRPGWERPPRPIRPPVNRPIYWPGHNVNWGYHYPVGGRYFADTIRCESLGGRFRSCYVRTQGRVVLERRHHGRCRYGNGWGYDRNRIWVNHNCRATFAYGVGSYIPRYRSDPSDAALVIGGVAVAAGLVAILSQSASSRKADSFPVQSSARIEADLGDVRASARPALSTCLDKAASNVAATGGSSIHLIGVTIDDLGGGTYRYDVDVAAKYPDRSRNLAFSCTANKSEVDEFGFVTDRSD